MEGIRTAILAIAATGLIVPALLDFAWYRKSRQFVVKEKTVTSAVGLLGFFIAISWMAKAKIGALTLPATPTVVMLALGATLIVLSGLLNCFGRLELGKNWSDDIAVFMDHHLVVTGVYGRIRHPLFSSLLGLSIGVSLVYGNAVDGCSTLFILFPALYVRARKEERMLCEHVPGYAHYLKQVSMFVPTRRKRYVHD